MSTTDSGTSPDRMNAMMGSAAVFAEPQATSEPQGGTFGQPGSESQSSGQQANAANMQNVPGGTLDARPSQPTDSGNGQAAAQPGSSTPPADGAQASPSPEAAGPSTDAHAPGASADGGAAAGGATDTPPVDASASAGAGGQGSTSAEGSASAGNSGSSADGSANSSITDPIGVSGLVDNLLSPLGGAVPLHLAGQDAVTQPVLNVANAAVLDLHNVLESLSDQTGTASIVHGLTNLGETIGLGQLGAEPGAGGNSNLLTDVLNLPGDTLNGDLGSSLDHIGTDLTDVVHATAGLGNSVLNGPDALNPIPELISSVGSDLQSNPLLTLGGTEADGKSGLLSGVVGDLSHSSSGHLVDANVDGLGTSPLVVDALAATGTGPQSPIDVNVVDVGPNGPQVADIGVNTDAPAPLLAPLAGGNDGLVGTIAQITSIASTDGAPLSDLGSIEDVASIAPIGGDHGLLHLGGTQII
ncbi:hypothetical protein LPW26_22915 [Rhodopseudomonas sp. HC1]|uniref:hypothetical protein n=1 Tax=Rhodopseudomonas infernalis TaxID=2897386 RepID=UPI001EE7BF4B|nr:hypothetical protein [Rhodopseudomonas infernalis]MCG6207508.1 hypothetical protein [Rhodopseudomonas infernalis]